MVVVEGGEGARECSWGGKVVQAVVQAVGVDQTVDQTVVQTVVGGGVQIFDVQMRLEEARQTVQSPAEGQASHFVVTGNDGVSHPQPATWSIALSLSSSTFATGQAWNGGKVAGNYGSALAVSWQSWQSAW